jgi:oxygen-independent coproporphyrinogen-3 oxidase
VEACTGFRSSAVEVTVECNPESLDEHKAEALLRAGATRLSIGVQSLRPEILELFGRVHDADQALRAVRAARSAGVERLSVDMIYAVPGQTSEQWEADLTRVLELEPDHLSAYNLTFEPGTPLESARRRGGVGPLDEETELAMFWSTRRIAGAFGLAPYEISNFAQAGEECRHNLAYWANEEYVGVGPSAVSKVGATRAANPRDIGRWRRGVERDGSSIASREELEPRARLGETWWLGLRRATGLEPARARRAADVEALWPTDDADPALAIAKRLAGHGLLERVGAAYRLTERGLPLADGVAKEFLA